MRLQGDISPKVDQNLWTRIAWGTIMLFGILSLLAPFIANEKPIYIHDGTKAYWPIFSNVNWEKICRNSRCEKISTIIPFSPETIDVSSIHSKPFSYRKTAAGGLHVLGTDQLGRDVLAALVHGSRTAMWVSLLATFLAFVVGLLYGLAIGFFGNDKIRYSIKQIVGLFILLVITYFLCVFIWNAVQGLMISKFLGVILLGVCFILFIAVIKISTPLLRGKQANYLDVDSLGMRVVDLIKALPVLFIVLFALQIHEADSMWYMICLIAFLFWAAFARHSRAEVLRLRNTPAVQSALLTGRSDFWIWRNNILPFIVRPLLVIAAFSMASAILLEATLSFLGLGLPAEHVSWGTLINSARSYSSSWWLLVFPGLCMLSLIWALQHLGRTLEEKLRNRQSLRSV